MGIFSENAPLYWSAGLPVVPLHRWSDVNPQNGKSIGKAPALPHGWQRYCKEMPTPEEQTAWLATYPEGNIGLPLGEQSRCVALDVDSEIEAEVALIDKLVPTSPWVRVGRHGHVLMFRYNGEQTCRIKDITGRTIVELLAGGTQVVLPPSIHPTTQRPYTSNTNLYDVVDRLPILPKDIETTLRHALSDAGVTLSVNGSSKTIDYVSAGSRDVKMTSVAGVYCLAVLRGEITLKTALEMMRAWVADRVEHVAGDDVDPDKGCRNIIKFFIDDVTGEKKRPLPKGWDVGITDEEREKWGLNIFNEENEVWDFPKLNVYLKNKLTKSTDEGERAGIVDYALTRISRSSMSAVEEEQCLQYMVHTSNTLSIGVLRKRLLELKREGIVGNDQTEIAQAALRDYDKKIPNYDKIEDGNPYPSLRFAESHFWAWGGSNWEILPDSVVEKFVATEYGSLPAAKKAGDHKGIVHIMSTMLDDKLASVDVKGVNFANGFVDVYGKLHEHSKKYGCTYTLPYCYKESDGSMSGMLVPNAPRFTKFLQSVWGADADFTKKVHCLRQVMASTMFGLAPSFARAILLYGIAGSGKSQLLTIVRKMLPPEIVSMVSPYNFNDKFMVTELSKSVLNICGELKENVPMSGDTFKQVIDGSPMQGQFKGKAIFNFSPKAAHWFASNYLPQSQDTSAGFNRRWVILGFNKPCPKEEKVRDLGDIIVAEEREAIATWCVGAMAELHSTSDYDLPPSHYEYVTRMASENDSLFFYLTSEGEKAPRINPEAKTSIQEFYTAYRDFCYSKAGSRPIGQRKFLTRLQELCLICKLTISGNFVNGVELGDEGEMIRGYLF